MKCWTKRRSKEWLEYLKKIASSEGKRTFTEQTASVQICTALFLAIGWQTCNNLNK